MAGAGRVVRVRHGRALAASSGALFVAVAVALLVFRGDGGGTALELSSFTRPDHELGSPAAMSNELGLRNVAFEVDDLDTILDRLAADGYRLVGGVGQYEQMWRMAYVRGPEGIIVALAQRIG